MTTSTFAASATEDVEPVSPRIVMIDGRRLAELLIIMTWGSLQRRPIAVDQDYFVESD